MKSVKGVGSGIFCLWYLFLRYVFLPLFHLVTKTANSVAEPLEPLPAFPSAKVNVAPKRLPVTANKCLKPISKTFKQNPTAKSIFLKDDNVTSGTYFIFLFLFETDVSFSS